MLAPFIKIFKRSFCSSNESGAILAKSLKIFENGDPSKVLSITQDELIATRPNQVLVKVLAAPVHTVDINGIKGESTRKCFQDVQFPIIPGIECVGEVCSVASSVTTLSPGERVVAPYSSSTWTTYSLFDAEDLTTIPNELDLADAATLTVHPCTAYRILKDFVVLKPGDCVLLNGPNTALGQAMHQMCKAWQLNSVGIIKDDQHVDELKSYISSKGATKVLSLNELRETKIFEDGTLPKPRLALSCVGRSSSRELARFLDNHGVMVSYGCMAGRPLAAATAALVFKDFVQRPFWMMRWSKLNPKIDERNKMVKEVSDMIVKKDLERPETEFIPFMEYKEALKKKQTSLMGATPKTIILDMQCEE